MKKTAAWIVVLVAALVFGAVAPSSGHTIEAKKSTPRVGAEPFKKA